MRIFFALSCSARLRASYYSPAEMIFPMLQHIGVQVKRKYRKPRKPPLDMGKRGSYLSPKAD